VLQETPSGHDGYHFIRAMLFKNLNASSALALAQYPDIDSFRTSERYVHAQSIPLYAGHYSVPRARLSLPSCSVSLMRTFPRIIKGYEVPGRVLVVAPMDGVSSARINGRNIGKSLVFISGVANCTVFEPEARLVAILSIDKSALQRALQERDLQGFDGGHLLLDLPEERLEAFQLLIRRLIECASGDPEAMETRAFQEVTDRTLLVEIEEAMRVGKIASRERQTVRDRHQAIVDRIDHLLQRNPAASMDSSEIADDLGVSTRTLHNAMQSVCGLSTLRYLRIRRLWMVRDQLRSGRGGLTVRASALAHGFHHMGDFSDFYKATFGEMPSQTLANRWDLEANAMLDDR
jgi:AraC family transcriptional regulator, ethanolamine operon transcriptional activator